MGNIGGWVNGDCDLDGQVDGGDYALIDFAFSARDETTTAAAACLGGGLVDEGTMALASMVEIADHYALFGNDYKDQVQTLLDE